MILKRLKNFLNKIQYFLANERILVIGDSHVLVFKHYNFKLHFPFKYFEVVSVGGATASGLENPNSKTQAYKIFNKALQHKQYNKIIIMLGEVDTGFVIWYRAKKYNENVERMLIDAVNKYTKFIKKASSFANTIVISTPLPTIDDNSVGEVVNARKEVDVFQYERTKLTIKFNKLVEDFCKKNNIKYLNLDMQSLGENGLVKKQLKNKNPADHHYDTKEYSKLIIKNLKKYL